MLLLLLLSYERVQCICEFARGHVAPVIPGPIACSVKRGFVYERVSASGFRKQSWTQTSSVCLRRQFAVIKAGVLPKNQQYQTSA